MNDPQEQEQEKKESLVESMEWVVDMMNTSTNIRREDVYPANRYHGD